MQASSWDQDLGAREPPEDRGWEEEEEEEEISPPRNLSVLTFTFNRRPRHSNVHFISMLMNIRMSRTPIEGSLVPGCLTPRRAHILMWSRVDGYSNTPFIIHRLCTEFYHTTFIIQSLLYRADWYRNAKGSCTWVTIQSWSIQEYLGCVTLARWFFWGNMTCI